MNYLAILLLLTAVAWAVDDTSFDSFEQDFTLSRTSFQSKPNPQASSYISPSRMLLNRLRTRKHKYPKGSAFESHERTSTLEDDRYKPWGAASLPQHNNHNNHHGSGGNQVIVDNIDDELFTPNSEVHTYDQQLRIHPFLH